ncbi:hypothetical protein, partial [Streptomyces sp. NPDC054804]
MEDDLPTVSVRLWRADAIVLFDWLMTTDLDSVPVTHPAQKQALADLLSRDCQTSGVTGVVEGYCRAAERRPSKVMSKAFS